MTENHIEQLKMETLYERAQHNVAESWTPLWDEEVTQRLYKYPDGEVNVLYNPFNEDETQIEYSILTNDGYQKTVTQQFPKAQKDPY
ncbi:hypothetical protein N780_16540 [Pontibacillus chungwhensis BH030062]|uniref:Uncharacterized protein n=1 Tax=Pontibacillus chungwhensis BH030062 TaxID=1385513 RepID=A0A0A2UVQ6_9BACI|nr:hypothetical protein [Pontibacillus chungwhensis]KGP92019.1 hypothetical protein N780_16540 [Pontibacillus chungwhensis BH030062]